MTFTHFLKKTILPACDHPQEQRLGQFLMNKLYEYNPALYSKVPPELDPFHSDSRVWDFMVWLKSNWENT